MSEDRYPLSVIVHTKNSQETLTDCLNSVKFAQEIVIVDMQSTDQTKKVAEKFTKRFFSVDDSGYVETVRNFGISKVHEEWVLILDADEELSDGLKIWLESFLTSPKSKGETIAYYLPRKNYMFGQEVRHTGWWPDYQLRLFKKSTVSWPEQIHSKPIVEGKTEYLPPDSEKCVVHHNYKNVAQFVERMNRYTTITAEESKLKEVLSPAQLVKTFSDEFTQRALKWEGVSDGGIGVSLSFLQATYQLLVKLKQWEANKFLEKEETASHGVAALQAFKVNLAYWIANWYVENTSGLAKMYWIIRRKFRV